MIATAPKRAALLLVLLAACSGSHHCDVPPPRVFFEPFSAAVLHVEVADTPETQARGLMGRHHLDQDSGMLFLFDGPTTQSFWMKDTLIPLSIAFFDHSRRIIAIREMAPCRTPRCRTYRAPAPYVGAIEANRGYFSTHGIERGDRVRISANACQ